MCVHVLMYTCMKVHACMCTEFHRQRLFIRTKCDLLWAVVDIDSPQKHQINGVPIFARQAVKLLLQLEKVGCITVDVRVHVRIHCILHVHVGVHVRVRVQFACA